jgi:hypothetical protein
LHSFDAASKPEITNLDGAVIIDKDIGGLDVPVDHLARMQVLECTEDVVNYGLYLRFFKMLRRFK